MITDCVVTPEQNLRFVNWNRNVVLKQDNIYYVHELETNKELHSIENWQYSALKYFVNMDPVKERVDLLKDILKVYNEPAY